MKKTIGLLLLSSFLTTTASAAVLKNVTVNGTQRLEDSTIMSYLNVKKGQNITSSDLDKATKTLFATGLFSDVRIQMNNGTMSVQLEENPIVRDVFFEGNDKLDDDILKTEITLKPRSVYTKNKAQSDADRLLEVYKRNGRFGATVTPKIIQKDQNRVDIVFEIDEGAKTVIEKINFIGNQHFSSDELKDVMITKESAWYRFLPVRTHMIRIG